VPSDFSLETTSLTGGPAEIQTEASGGVYPVVYTLWRAGTYDVYVESDGVNIDGSPFELVVWDNVVHGSTSYADGQGLIGGVAGTEFSFTVQAMDERSYDVQTVTIDSDVVDETLEIHSFTCLDATVGSSSDVTFELFATTLTTDNNDFSFTIDEDATSDELKTALENLPLIHKVEVSIDGDGSLCGNNLVSITFVEMSYELPDTTVVSFSAGGSIEPVQLSGLNTFSNVNVDQQGETASRKSVWQVICSQSSGNVEIGVTSSSRGTQSLTLSHDTDLTVLSNSLSNLAASHGDVTAFSPRNATMLCDSSIPVYLVFHSAGSDLNLESSDLELSKVVEGVIPVSGTFTLTFKEKTTSPIPYDASAEEMQNALEALDTIGQVSVGLDLLKTSDSTSASLGAFRIWTVSFDGEMSWPMNIGSQPKLVPDTSSLSNPSTQSVLALPRVRVTHTEFGNTGNPRRDGTDNPEITIVSLENCTFNQCDNPDTSVRREFSTSNGTISVRVFSLTFVFRTCSNNI